MLTQDALLGPGQQPAALWLASGRRQEGAGDALCGNAGCWSQRPQAGDRRRACRATMVSMRSHRFSSPSSVFGGKNSKEKKVWGEGARQSVRRRTCVPADTRPALQAAAAGDSPRRRPPWR